MVVSGEGIFRPVCAYNITDNLFAYFFDVLSLCWSSTRPHSQYISHLPKAPSPNPRLMFSLISKWHFCNLISNNLFGLIYGLFFLNPTLEAVLDIRSAQTLQTCSQFTVVFLNFLTEDLPFNFDTIWIRYPQHRATKINILNNMFKVFTLCPIIKNL
jgi:hypothetical protein